MTSRPPPACRACSTTVSPSDAVIVLQPRVFTPWLASFSAGDMKRPTNRPVAGSGWKKSFLISSSDRSRSSSTTLQPGGGQCGVSQRTLAAATCGVSDSSRSAAPSNSGSIESGRGSGAGVAYRPASEPTSNQPPPRAVVVDSWACINNAHAMRDTRTHAQARRLTAGLVRTAIDGGGELRTYCLCVTASTAISGLLRVTCSARARPWVCACTTAATCSIRGLASCQSAHSVLGRGGGSMRM